MNGLKIKVLAVWGCAVNTTIFGVYCVQNFFLA